MAGFRQTDWYRFPKYYDIVFGPDTAPQADFIEAVLERHGPARVPSTPRVLEPACGSGRLVIELARRGHRVTGFDTSREMLAYARERAAAEPPAVRRRIDLRRCLMQNFSLRGPYHIAHCLLSTFKYLLRETDARTHLDRVARCLAPGGVYILGLHLTDYRRRRNEKETWRETAGEVRVVCETITRPAEPATRLESLRNRLRIQHAGARKIEQLETNWMCRAYDLGQLKSLLNSVSALEPVACYDFNHDIDAPEDLDRTDGDPVVILRKTGAKPAIVRP